MLTDIMADVSMLDVSMLDVSLLDVSMLVVSMLDVSIPCTVMLSIISLMKQNQNRYTKLNETFSESDILTVVIE